MIKVEHYDHVKHYAQLLRMRLREDDQRELLASSACPSYIIGLQQSVEVSDIVCYVYLYEGRIVALSGARKTHLSSYAIVWAMGTDEVLEHWHEVEPLFTKHVNAVLDEPGIEIIGNVIDLRNDAHIRWIKKLKFIMTGDIITMNGYKFESFYKKKKEGVPCVIQD